MLYDTCNITQIMARGQSGRIVIEINPEVKRRLYAALALSGSTLKDWFVREAEQFSDESWQPSLYKTPASSASDDNVAETASAETDSH